MGKDKSSREKPRVAIVMPNHADMESSLGNYVKTLQYIARKGWADITLLTDEKNDIKIDGIPVKKIKGIDYKTIGEKILLLLGIPRHYYPGLEKELGEYDVILSNNPEFYGYAYQSYKAARKLRKRFVLRTSQTVDGFFLYHLTRFVVNPLVKGAYAYASWNIFANPEAQERAYRLGFLKGGSKTMVTGHATDTECFRPMRAAKPKNTILLSVGGLLRLKGHQHIMEALCILHNDGNVNAELWIVGKGPYENDLRKRAENLGIESKVKFLGSKGHKDLARIYSQASVFVLANEQEITPAVNEALACGIPVVAMECGGCRYVLGDEEYGLISKRFDPGDMAMKIEQTLGAKMSIKDAARRRKRIVDEFSIPIVARKVARSFV